MRANREGDMENTTVGEHIKRARNLRGFSQEGLSELAGINSATIWGLETGRHAPRPSTLRKLAEALGLEVPDLLTGNYEAMTSAGKAFAPAPR